MWLVPSFKRPQNLARLLESCRDTGMTSRLVIRLMEDDPTLAEYRAIPLPENATFHVGPRVKAPAACQWALQLFPDEACYGFLGDDVVLKTDGWDVALALHAGLDYISYPDDGIHGEHLCTHPCIGGDLVRSVGFWGLPGLDHNFMDTVWYSLGRGANLLHYCPHVKFDHRHPVAHKAEDDEVYRLGRENYELDKQRYLEFCSGNARVLVASLQIRAEYLREIRE